MTFGNSICYVNGKEWLSKQPKTILIDRGAHIGSVHDLGVAWFQPIGVGRIEVSNLSFQHPPRRLLTNESEFFNEIGQLRAEGAPSAVTAYGVINGFNATAVNGRIWHKAPVTCCDAVVSIRPLKHSLCATSCLMLQTGVATRLLSLGVGTVLGQLRAEPAVNRG